MLCFPVVLITGFTNTPECRPLIFVDTILDEMRIEHFTPHIPPFGSIEERSRSLIENIVAKYPRQIVHLFGHSMGGINARDIAAKSMWFDLGFRVGTVTTFGTPHRGVNWNPLPGIDGSSVLAGIFRCIFDTDFGGAGNLSQKFMTKFNQKTANNPHVRYYTWAGETSIPMAQYLHSFAPSRAFGPTDGLVNVSSAAWAYDLGPGIHLGTVRGLNHLTIICRMTVQETIVHLQAAENGQIAIVRPIENGIIAGISRRIKKQESLD